MCNLDFGSCVVKEQPLLFQPEREAELRDALLQNGYDAVKPLIQCPDVVPQWGQAIMQDGVVRIQQIDRQRFGVPLS